MMSPGRLTALMCGAEVLTMAGAFAFPALLPRFFAEWSLNSTEAGWISGIYFGAYALGAVLFVPLTDRIDARRVWLAGAALTAFSSAGFALLAEGFLTAMAFRVLAGLGLAGTYMPGLRVLVDRYTGAKEARAIAFYTSSFSLGTSLSFLLAGEVGDALGWRWAFLAAALVGLGAMVLVGLGLGVAQPHRVPEGGSPFDFRPILRNRPAMGYILGYGIHTGELFALRSWQVAMLAFVLAGSPDGQGWPDPTTVAMLVGLLAMISSIGGNELAGRFGRRRTIVAVMLGSSLAAAALAWGADGGYAGAVILMLVYGVLVQGDSAALTAGVVGVAEPGRRGATLALHSLIGFGGGFLAPLGLGIVLDLAGGPGSAEAWRMAFLSMAAIGLAGPVFVSWLRK